MTDTATAGHARTVLATHVERDGVCEGRLSQWARLASFPCEQVQQARAVLNASGVTAPSRPAGT